MMKRYYIILSIILLVAGCQNKDENAPSSNVGIAPKVESVSLAEGAVDVSIETNLIDIIYDLPIEIKDNSKIVMNDVSLSAAAANMRLRIEFDGLDYGTEYTLVLEQGAIKSKSSDSMCEAFTLSFTTEEEVLPPLPPYTPGEPGNYSQQLVTENPIDNARRLYEYMLSIYGEKTLSGAMAKVNWNLDEVNWIKEWTGKYPAMATFDYIHLPFSPASWIDYGDITPAREWFEKGGIVSASWHWNVPLKEGSSEYTFNTGTTFKASNVVKEGTWENEIAKQDLEKIAGYLKLLQDEGIPVVWRPLHEAAGNTYTQWHSGAWFWWGAEGAKAYRELWVYMFNYFKEAGLRNLIWVWTTQTSMESDADYEYYPGVDYVDIVGRDIYNNTNASDIASQYTTITRMVTDKMVTLSENGNVSDMDAQWNSGAKWLYFMPWYDNDNDWSESFAHDHATIAWWKKSFSNSAVLDLSALPSDLYVR